MTSKEALKRIRDDIEINYLTTKYNNEKDKYNYLELLKIIEKDLEILEFFRKIDKKELKDFIENQIKYTLNENSWLSACNADLAKEKPTKHLIKIKDWLENDERI